MARALATDSDAPRRALRLTLGTLEVAKGHDGLLRGKPEPAFLVAVYRSGGPAGAALVGRLLARAKLRGEIPCQLEIRAPELRYDARFAESERVVVVVVAAEEDSGASVQRMYAALEAPEQLLFYDTQDLEPSPRGLGEWATLPCAMPKALPIEVLFDGDTTTKFSDESEYVSACAFNLGVGVRDRQLWRMAFADAEKLNDWALSVSVQVV